MSVVLAPDATAFALHRDAIVIDALSVAYLDRSMLERMQRAGVTATNLTVTTCHDFRQSVEILADRARFLEEHADIAIPIRSVADIRRAKAEGKVGIIDGTQNGTPIEADPRLVWALRELGLRIIQLTYSTRNLIGEGCMERTNGGLSIYGREVVREMNRLGIVVDLSHVGSGTTLDTIEWSEAPVIVSHTGVKAVRDHPRNRSDEELKLLAARGGVAGIVAWSSFLRDPAEGHATLDDLFHHLDHAVSLIGIDHVGIGLDFLTNQPVTFTDTRAWGGAHFMAQSRASWKSMPAWPARYPDGIASIDDLPNITAGLLARGYGPDDVRKLLGGNFVRIFEQIWQ
jgi:membrane dipeptidase